MTCISKRTSYELITFIGLVIVVIWLVLVIVAMHETCNAADLKWNIVQYFISRLPIGGSTWKLTTDGTKQKLFLVSNLYRFV